MGGGCRGLPPLRIDDWVNGPSGWKQLQSGSHEDFDCDSHLIQTIKGNKLHKEIEIAPDHAHLATHSLSRGLQNFTLRTPPEENTSNHYQLCN